MLNGKFLNVLLIGTLLCAYIKPNWAVSSCWFGAGEQYAKLSCATGYTASCVKRVDTYQGHTIVSGKACSPITCDATITQGQTTNNGDGSTSSFWCCTSDNCNLSSALISNKLLIGLSILVATFVAFYKSN